ncbi:hypothetical protein DI272_18875 [Streptomyces sp. Act143]|uniref:hypothetical protein n=1 Tax=Streptomyces sp. Act143 TaxID=2200760 RepID=UPI000D68405A|nr:hypothetical protein [Streptomyces sp. Act143]PWI15997.1 hypothetical protein DI272_18875 [Streptomyces sp. Act143]
MDNIIITDTGATADEGTGIVLTAGALDLLTPWLRDTLTAQDRADENSDLCQLLTSILRVSADTYGTPAPSRATCICHG